MIVVGNLLWIHGKVYELFQSEIIAVMMSSRRVMWSLRSAWRSWRRTDWWRPDLQPDPGDPLSQYRYVHRDNQDGEDMRTALVRDDLKHANVSLKIRKVKLSDGGRYRCVVPQLGSASVIKLVVGEFVYIHTIWCITYMFTFSQTWFNVNSLDIFQQMNFLLSVFQFSVSSQASVLPVINHQ